MGRSARRASGATLAAVLLVALTVRLGAQQIPGASTGAAAALARGESLGGDDLVWATPDGLA